MATTDHPRYRTIVADPPWRYDDGFATQSVSNGVPNGPATRHALPYPSMDLDEIKELPLDLLAEPDARIFVWTTNRYLPATFGIVAWWGFTYRQTLTWRKRGQLQGSIAPNAKFVVVATRGAPPRLGRFPSPVIDTAAPKIHSAKPEAFLDLVEQVSPGPYLELFARRNRLGWDTWGNEALEHVTIESGR